MITDLLFIYYFTLNSIIVLPFPNRPTLQHLHKTQQFSSNIHLFRKINILL